MKLFILVLLFAIAFTSIVDEINNANVGWTAQEYEQFAGKTKEELRSLLNTHLGPYDLPKKEFISYEALPTNFDPRDKWPSCIHAIRDQGNCGSCWAFGAAEALTDRFCIQKNIDVILSTQDLVSCDKNNYGCDGGYLDVAWAFMKATGVVTEECYPYTSGTSGQTGSCKRTCKDGSTGKKYHASNYYSVSGITNIMNELYTNGPTEGAFEVYEDFMNYKSGVYRHISGSYLGGHAIKVMGWGVESGKEYWLCANSWGTSWGISGYFKILKGVDECGIEDDIVAGMAGTVGFF
eukprot:Anaeramoba_ignava/a607900_9687.p1 GENE.a607900_9687~~a607900_9687.p1  ORF type:complete len:319 (-),score=62.17 a607900_9687:39-917(-)